MYWRYLEALRAIIAKIIDTLAGVRGFLLDQMIMQDNGSYEEE